VNISDLTVRITNLIKIAIFVNMFFDTHNHSQFSFDGGATTVEKSVRAAVDKGFG
jgi:hypothetical protein